MLHKGQSGTDLPTAAAPGSASFEAERTQDLDKAFKRRRIECHSLAYKPLSGEEPVRVLRLLPAENSDAIIECELAHIDFKSGLPLLSYEALSYAWGSLTEKRFISIRQASLRQPGKARAPESTLWATDVAMAGKLAITQNLESALRHLRLRDKGRILWIDAICINQSDINERNTQVRRMHIIYNKASRVCIWLGPASHDSDNAIMFIEQVLNLSNLDKLVNDFTTVHFWKALLSLISRPWFNRRWVVQELAVAKAASVYCGTKCVPWTHLADVIALCKKKSNDLVKLFMRSKKHGANIRPFIWRYPVAASCLVQLTSNVFSRDADGNILEHLLNLEELVALLPTFRQTDVKDVLYALVSLAKDTQYTSHDYMGGLPVDYSKTYPEVCRDFIDLTISTTGSLDILCRPWAVVSEGAVLPSWIRPMTEYVITAHLDNCLLRQQADSLVGAPGKPIYKASGDTKADPPKFFNHQNSRFESSPHLILKGFEVDKIAELGSYAKDGIVPVSWLDMAINAEMENGALSMQDGKMLPDSFWRTLVADRCSKGQSPPSWYRRCCEDVFRSDCISEIITPKVIATCNNSFKKEFLTRVLRSVWNKRFATTLGYHDDATIHTGLVPRNSKVGDGVFILHGCSVPVLLRKEDKHYIFIGECYIHGIMDGVTLKLGHRAVRIELR